MFRLGRMIINEGSQGLFLRKGIIQGVLQPGMHGFSIRNESIETFDLRPDFEIVGGQESMTKDGGLFKVSILIGFQIEDIKLKYNSSADGYFTQLGRNPRYQAQSAIREWLMSRTFNECFDQRENITVDIEPGITLSAKNIGVKVNLVQLLDMSMVGSVRTAYANLLSAEIEGQTALARARNEAATMRSLLNTAKLVREHPGLLELRVLSSGSKPRVNFSVNSFASSNESQQNPEENS